MTKRLKRKPIFCAVEGEGEQSFIKFLQIFSDETGLHVQLDCKPLGGGGYSSMLNTAVHSRNRKGRHNVKDAILLVDADRAERDDNWTIEKLRSEASKAKFTLCLQQPNLEGLLLRLVSNADLRPPAANALQQLRKNWPDYQKPVDAQTLKSKIKMDDLLRVAKVDSDLRKLLSIVGLTSP